MALSRLPRPWWRDAWLRRKKFRVGTIVVVHVPIGHAGGAQRQRGQLVLSYHILSLRRMSSVPSGMVFDGAWHPSPIQTSLGTQRVVGMMSAVRRGASRFLRGT